MSLRWRWMFSSENSQCPEIQTPVRRGFGNRVNESMFSCHVSVRTSTSSRLSAIAWHNVADYFPQTERTFTQPCVRPAGLALRRRPGSTSQRRCERPRCRSGLHSLRLKIVFLTALVQDWYNIFIL